MTVVRVEDEVALIRARVACVWTRRYRLPVDLYCLPRGSRLNDDCCCKPDKLYSWK